MFGNQLILLHGISDGILALALYAIALELVYLVWRRRDLAYPKLFLAVAAVILGCGTISLVQVLTLALPLYWLSGGIKATTAVVAFSLAVGVALLIPRVLALRGRTELEEMNERLTLEIRERQQVEAELLRSREALVRQERLRLTGQLASGIAHDLNNTLNVAKLRLTAVQRDPAVQAQHGRRLNAIDRALDDAARTVARVQELGKRRVEQTELTHLQTVIEEVLALSRNSIEARSSLSGQPIEIETDIPHGLPAVRGHASELKQVILGLLLNAAEAMEQEGKIRIAAAVEGENVVVRVSDEGKGIPEDQLERAFEPFFTTTGGFGGGLGLSISREIVEGAGGTIKAASRQEGGVVITLSFPIPHIQDFPTSEQQSSAAGRKCSFLLIDDDANNLEALNETLMLEGHATETARSGTEGLDKLRTRSTYDVILCDLSMPGLNGWQTARDARALAPNSLFFVLTGWGVNDIGEKPPVPIAGVLQKPVKLSDIDHILQMVKSA